MSDPFPAVTARSQRGDTTECVVSIMSDPFPAVTARKTSSMPMRIPGNVPEPSD